MRKPLLPLFAAATLFLSAPATAQAQAALAPAAALVRDVRAAAGCADVPCTPPPDFAKAEAILDTYRAQHGDTSEVLEGLSWLGRAALAANRFDDAFAYAAETASLAGDALKERTLANDARLATALGAAIEVQAQARAARGDRSDAVYFLQREIEQYRDTPIERRLQKNLLMLSLEGQPMPAIDAADVLDAPVPTAAQLKGKAAVLFFWAHWCPDCKAQAPILARLLDRYRAAGLTIVAPTQLYGYTERRATPAGPDQEREYILKIRDTYYPFLRGEAVPVSAANHTNFGVSTTPTVVVVDRAGIVTRYHPGTMTEDELRAAIETALGR